MDTENENAKEFSLSKSAKPQEKDLSAFHEEQRAEKSNKVEHCLLPVSNISQNIEKSVPEVKPFDDSNLATIKDKTTRKPKRTVATVIPVLILAIVVAGLALIPVLLFILNTNVHGLEAGCTAEVYIGEVCQSILVDRQRCIPSRENTSEVYVLLTPSLQAIVEQQLLDLLQFVTPSPECEGQLLAFLCVEAFSGFCDSTGIVHRTTRQECEVVTSEVCAAEFEVIFPLLEGSGFDLSCDTFTEISNICNYTYYIEKERTGSGQFRASGETLYTGLEGNRSCSDNFFLDETTNLCMPECGEWWPISANRRKLLTTIVLTSICCGNVVSIVVIFLSCLHYKTMFTFPGIFIFYQMLSLFVASILHLLTYVDIKNMMCESRNLIESLMQGNETPLCIISAVSVTYVSHQIALWWIFHLSMIFCAVFWPFKYNYWKQLGYFKYIHTVMVAAGIILSIIPVIICLKVDGYVLYLILPNCVPRNIQSAFYSYLLPMIVVVAIGLYLLILIFWKLFSEEWMCSQRQHNTKRQVEIKILLLFCCYLVIWSDIIGVTVARLIEADDYKDTIMEYFTCEASGTLECERNFFDTTSRLFASVIVSLYPAIFLIYFVKTKNSLLCSKQCRFHASSGTSTSVLSRSIH